MSGDTRPRPSRTGVAHLERGGLEMRGVPTLREHGVLTVLVGGGPALSDGPVGVDQILSVRPGATRTVPVVQAW